MKLEVRHVESDPPAEAQLTAQVVQQALQIVARRLAAAGAGDAHLDLDSLDVVMPVPAAQLKTPHARHAAAQTLALRILQALETKLGRTLVGKNDAVHGGESRIDGVSYGDARLKVRKVPTQEKKGLLAGIGGLFGGKGGVRFVRPELTDADRTFADDLCRYQDLVWEGHRDPGVFRQLVAGLAAHLQRRAVAFRQEGTTFVIKPEREGSQLNILAWTARKKIHSKFDMVYDARKMLVDGQAVGSFNSDDHRLYLDTRSIAWARPSGTALHELHHAYLYKRIDAGQDSIVNLQMRSTLRDASDPRSMVPMSSSGMYTGYMSTQELSTFTKQPRQVLGLHLRSGPTWTAALQTDLDNYLNKLEHVAIQSKEVPDKLIPELERFLGGSNPAVKVKDGEDIYFTAHDQGLHHRITVQTTATKTKTDQDLARDLLAKLQLLRTVAAAVLAQLPVIRRELARLPEGASLSPIEVQRLKDLTGWPGYVMRVATGDLTLAEKMAELERQKAIADQALSRGPEQRPPAVEALS